MFIEDVYLELKKSNLCKSAYEFSAEYLGKNQSYYSVLKVCKVEPSIGVLMVLYFSLVRQAEVFSGRPHEAIKRAHAKLMQLAKLVQEEVDKRCGGDLASAEYESILR